MNIKLKKLTEEDKKTICSWKYEDKYSVFNLPDYNELIKTQACFCNPSSENQFRSVFMDDRLIAYIRLKQISSSETAFGIGIKPDLCGKGLGSVIVKEACKLSNELYPESFISLQVRSWNTRAIKCYEKAGFIKDKEAFIKIINGREVSFYNMTKTVK